MDKLWVNLRLTDKEQLNPRRYMLTHSDETGELFLTIDSEYDYSKLPKNREEVLGEWLTFDGSHYYFVAYIHVDSNDDCFEQTKKRYDTFNRKLPLALSAIKAGDVCLFSHYPQLEAAPIYIQFNSKYPVFNQIANFKTFAAY